MSEKPPVEYIELNMSNFDDDDVSQLNEWGIWAVGRIAELEEGITWHENERRKNGR